MGSTAGGWATVHRPKPQKWQRSIAIEVLITKWYHVYSVFLLKGFMFLIYIFMSLYLRGFTALNGVKLQQICRFHLENLSIFGSLNIRGPWFFHIMWGIENYIFIIYHTGLVNIIHCLVSWNISNKKRMFNIQFNMKLFTFFCKTTFSKNAFFQHFLKKHQFLRHQNTGKATFYEKNWVKSVLNHQFNLISD